MVIGLAVAPVLTVMPVPLVLVVEMVEPAPIESSGVLMVNPLVPPAISACVVPEATLIEAPEDSALKLTVPVAPAEKVLDAANVMLLSPAT